MRYRRLLFWPHEISAYFEGSRDNALNLAMRAFEAGRIEPGWINEATNSFIKHGLWVDRRGLGIASRLCARGRTGEPFLEYHSDYRFRGPAWLWDVSPGEGPTSCGEIEKDILRLSTIARSEEEAAADFKTQLEKIQLSIDLQWNYIADFEDEVHESIRAKLVTTKFDIA